MKWLIATSLVLSTDRRAVTALEYTLIAAVIATVVVTAFTGLGTHMQTMVNTANAAL
jgi:Flp pilus assembly pilin Flp